MNQPALKLHDIHLPEAAGWWPPAIGWWVLAIIILLLLIWLTMKTWQWFKFYSWRKKLLNEFSQKISQPSQSSQSSQSSQALVTTITEALRQSALTLYPDDHVANLTGPDWLGFLESHGQHTPFSRPPGPLLIEAPYSDTVECDELSINQLKQMAMAWVKYNANRQRFNLLHHSLGTG
ncbi:MAG: DUF4381 domain-containing protein [Gammaproteobacteria bacterium]